MIEDLINLFILEEVNLTAESALSWHILVGVPWSTERNTFETYFNH